MKRMTDIDRKRKCRKIRKTERDIERLTKVEREMERKETQTQIVRKKGKKRKGGALAQREVGLYKQVCGVGGWACSGVGGAYVSWEYRNCRAGSLR